MGTYRKFGHSKLLYEAVVDEIERLVISGELQPGDSLPSERELGERYDVSRTVIREAIKVLSEKQLVSVVRGIGVMVAHPSHSTVTASLGLLFKLGKATPAHLTELRRGVEPEMAALAATRATAEQIEALEQIVADHRVGVTDPDKGVPLDVAFHWTIAEASHNEVFKSLIASIQELYRESMRTRFGIGNSNERTIYYHTQICRAIKERDAEAARLYMREHLDRVMQDHKLESDLARDNASPVTVKG